MSISPSQRPLPTQHTTNTRNEYPLPQRVSNPQSQESSDRRPRPLAVPFLIFLLSDWVASDWFHRNERASVATEVVCVMRTTYYVRSLTRFHSIKELRVWYLGLLHAANLKKH